MLNGVGSLVNALYSNGVEMPVVGMGATELCWTDRHAFTVISVSASGKTCVVQEDVATRVDNNGMSECQSYTFSPNPEGRVVTLRLTKKGWSYKGKRFHMGRRDC